MQSEVKPYPLYHWSPTDRRKRILKEGLRPSMWSTDRLWKPPYICFSDNPALAWSLSGDTERGQTIDSWDLWMTWTSVPTGFERIPYDIGQDVKEPTWIKEYRVYERIFKRDLTYIATRLQDWKGVHHVGT